MPKTMQNMFLSMQKVHTFQKSLEAVLQRLGEAEIGQNTLTNAGNIAGTENEILLFRNQLKVSSIGSGRSGNIIIISTVAHWNYNISYQNTTHNFELKTLLLIIYYNMKN